MAVLESRMETLATPNQPAPDPENVLQGDYGAKIGGEVPWAQRDEVMRS